MNESNTIPGLPVTAAKCGKDFTNDPSELQSSQKST
jgi:hypothetical protein